MKYADQRIHELERELVILQLCCRDIMRAIQAEQGDLPELRRLFVHLFEQRAAAVCEWRRLNNIGKQHGDPALKWSLREKGAVGDGGGCRHNRGSLYPSDGGEEKRDTSGVLALLHR
jgi:hypothetical protein